MLSLQVVEEKRKVPLPIIIWRDMLQSAVIQRSSFIIYNLNV